MGHSEASKRSRFSRIPPEGLPKGSYPRATDTIDKEIKAKRNNMISELITLRITKAKAKVKFGVKYLRGHECKRSSVQLISINSKAKAKEYFRIAEIPKGF